MMHGHKSLKFVIIHHFKTDVSGTAVCCTSQDHTPAMLLLLSAGN